MPRKPTALAEAMKDTLFAALAQKLPAPGSVWPRPKRKEWLDLLAASFSQIYHDAEPTEAAGSTAGTTSAATPPSSLKYWILPDGIAQAGTTLADAKMIDPHQIPQGTVVQDYRSSGAAGKWDDKDDPIVWLTQGAKVMRAPVGVKLRAAEGPLPAPAEMNGAGEGMDAGA